MTANQIAARQAQETERHNQEVEFETSLHNRNLEDLQQQQNDLNAKAENFNEFHQTRTQSWKEQYDSAYLEYQKASTDRKLELESQMNQIKRDEQIANRNYQESMVGIQRELNTINSSKQQEEARHNQEMERLQNQSILNEKAYRDAQINVSWYEAGTNRKSVLNNWTLTMDRNNTAYSQLLLDQERLSWEKERADRLDALTKSKYKSEEVLNYANAFNNYANAGTQIYKTIKGDNYGSKKTSEVTKQAAKLAWDSLFK